MVCTETNSAVLIQCRMTAAFINFFGKVNVKRQKNLDVSSPIRHVNPFF